MGEGDAISQLTNTLLSSCSNHPVLSKLSADEVSEIIGILDDEKFSINRTKSQNTIKSILTEIVDRLHEERRR